MGRGRDVKTTKRKAVDINSLPMPNWDFFDVPRYIAKSAHTITYGTGAAEEQKSVPMPISARERTRSSKAGASVPTIPPATRIATPVSFSR